MHDGHREHILFSKRTHSNLKERTRSNLIESHGAQGMMASDVQRRPVSPNDLPASYNPRLREIIA